MSQRIRGIPAYTFDVESRQGKANVTYSVSFAMGKKFRGRENFRKVEIHGLREAKPGIIHLHPDKWAMNVFAQNGRPTFPLRVLRRSNGTIDFQYDFYNVRDLSSTDMFSLGPNFHVSGSVVHGLTGVEVVQTLGFLNLLHF